MMELVERFVVAVEGIAAAKERLATAMEKQSDQMGTLVSETTDTKAEAVVVNADVTSTTTATLTTPEPSEDNPQPRKQVIKEFTELLTKQGKELVYNKSAGTKRFVAAIQYQKEGSACPACHGVGKAATGGDCPMPNCSNGKRTDLTGTEPVQAPVDPLTVENESEDNDDEPTLEMVRGLMTKIIAAAGSEEKGMPIAKALRDNATAGKPLDECPEGNITSLYMAAKAKLKELTGETTTTPPEGIAGL
jgi:hypothetical protein